MASDTQERRSGAIRTTSKGPLFTPMRTRAIVKKNAGVRVEARFTHLLRASAQGRQRIVPSYAHARSYAHIPTHLYTFPVLPLLASFFAARDLFSPRGDASEMMYKNKAAVRRLSKEMYPGSNRFWGGSKPRAALGAGLSALRGGSRKRQRPRATMKGRRIYLCRGTYI